MKAVCYSRYGDPDVLHLEDVPTPEPDAGRSLVKVRAAEATKSDCGLRSFRYAVKWFWLPLRLAIGVRRPRRRILGGHFADEITARLRPGSSRTFLQLTQGQDASVRSEDWIGGARVRSCRRRCRANGYQLRGLL